MKGLKAFVLLTAAAVATVNALFVRRRRLRVSLFLWRRGKGKERKENGSYWPLAVKNTTSEVCLIYEAAAASSASVAATALPSFTLSS